MPVLGDIMDKIIFLDIDGVLNDNTVNGYLERCVYYLKNLVDRNGGKVVIISSLQGCGTIEKRRRLSNKLGNVGINVSDYIDPNFKGDLNGVTLSNRVIGIIDYLKKYQESSYVIIDDEFHEEYNLLRLNNYKTDMWSGLTKSDVDKIKFKKVDKSILDQVSYKYRELGSYEKATNDLVKVLKKVLNERKGK